MKKKKKQGNAAGGISSHRRQFVDSAGRTWSIVITVATLRRVKHALRVQLLDAVNPDAKLCAQLGLDACLLADCLYLVCEEQCRDRGVSDEEFGRALAGDAIGEAAEALLRGIADFFPNRAQRMARHRLLDRGTKLLRTLEQTAMGGEPTFEAALTSFAERLSTGNASASPAS